jgi:hypothetical protein
LVLTAAAAAGADIWQQSVLMLGQHLLHKRSLPHDTTAAAMTSVRADAASQPLLLVTQHMLPALMLAQPSAAAAAAAGVNISTQPLTLLSQHMLPQTIMHVQSPAAAAAAAAGTASADARDQPLLLTAHQLLPQPTLAPNGHNVTYGTAYPLSSAGMPLQFLPASNGVAVTGAPVMAGVAEAATSSSSSMLALPVATNDLKYQLQLQLLQLKQLGMSQQTAGMYQLPFGGFPTQQPPAAAADVGIVSSGFGPSLNLGMFAAATAAGQIDVQHITTAGQASYPDAAACQLAGRSWLSLPINVLPGTGVAAHSSLNNSRGSRDACGMQLAATHTTAVQNYMTPAGVPGSESAAVTAATWPLANSW